MPNPAKHVAPLLCAGRSNVGDSDAEADRASDGRCRGPTDPHRRTARGRHRTQVALIQRWSARKQTIAPSEQGRRFKSGNRSHLDLRSEAERGLDATCSLCCPVFPCRLQSCFRRSADRSQYWRGSQSLSRAFCRVAVFRRTHRHRRSLLFGLHAGLEHDHRIIGSASLDLGFSCAEAGRRLRSRISRSRSDSRGGRRLSRADSQLDQPARQSEAKADLFARTGAHGLVSRMVKISTAGVSTP